MALIKCPECSKEISDKAISCPHCGFGLNTNVVNSTVTVQRKRSNAIPILLIICFVIVGFIGFDNAIKKNEQVKHKEDSYSSEAALARIGNTEYIKKASESKEEIDKLKTTRNVWWIVTAACGVGVCICVIIGVENEKVNRIIG